MADPTYPSSLTRSFIEVVGKHLPPEPLSLRVVDVGNRAGLVLLEVRPGLDIVPVSLKVDSWGLSPDSADVVVAYDVRLSQSLLEMVLAILRPGGCLIVVNPAGKVTPALVTLLEDAGYTQILIEPALTQPGPVGVVLRGEKRPATHHEVRHIPSPTERRQERHVHLLVRQIVDDSSTLIWQAVGVANEDETVLLAFSTLPKAIQFMQPAVVTGRIQDVNKVARFNWTVMKSWPQSFMLNPTDDILESYPVVFVPVDPDTAETVD
ncbi:MAG: hypothetical protein H6672_14330 [Anaerolineaceae bacterium]|nr:hypothetical protein [Anaerolineaceae bacterium]